MFLVYLAVVCSALSFLTGLYAVGSGANFQYETKHILQGRRDAILYIWVTFSSMFALAQLTSLVDYGMSADWGYGDSDTARWMVIHSGVGLLFTSAHTFIKGDLAEADSHNTFLWGIRARV